VTEGVGTVGPREHRRQRHAICRLLRMATAKDLRALAKLRVRLRVIAKIDTS
jgi:hypothetical protein